MVPVETGIGQCGNRTDVQISGDSKRQVEIRVVTVETETGQCGNSRQVQVGVVTGQTVW